MARKNTDQALRARLMAWLRYLVRKYAHHHETQQDFAAMIGISAPALSQYLNGRRTPGLDLLAHLHRGCHISADVLLDTDPPGTSAEDPPVATRKTPSPGRQDRNGD